MTVYIDTLCDEFPYQNKLDNKKTSTPAAEHLFEIEPNATKLDQPKAETFHTWVAKSLFVSKHSVGICEMSKCDSNINLGSPAQIMYNKWDQDSTTEVQLITDKTTTKYVYTQMKGF